MKTILLLKLLICAWLSTAAQAQDFLGPCEKDEYYRGVEERIDSAIGLKPELSLTTLPSFSPESGVRLVGSEVYYVEFQSSLWVEAYPKIFDIRDMDFVSPKVKTKVYHSSLNPDIAHNVMLAYGAAISAARRRDRWGMDGVSYRFTSPGAGCGEAWSPDPETHNATLVQLLELLAKHASLSKPSEMQRSEEAIVKTLKRLEAQRTCSLTLTFIQGGWLCRDIPFWGGP